MRQTLLQLTQDVLSAIDGDEINSINDTVESQQVVTIIKWVYDDIQSRAELPIQTTLFNLDASGDSAKPVLMTKPLTIDHLMWVKYNRVLTGNTDPVWQEIQFLCLEEFMLTTQSFLPSDAHVDTMSHTANGFTFTFHYKNSVGPTYYTTFNDNTMIFDAVDLAVDTTLQTSKTLGYGELSNTFLASDTFAPNLQPDQFALLFNEAKSIASVELRQMENAKAEKQARKNWAHLGKMKHTIPAGNPVPGPDYGRGSNYVIIPARLRNGS